MRPRSWLTTPTLEVLHLTHIIVTLNLILSKLSFFINIHYYMSYNELHDILYNIIR